jgi:AraC-like DNA-binding protein
VEGVISCEFLDIDHFREQLRGWDTPAIQIEPGPLSIRMRSIDLDGLTFFDIRVNRKVIDHSQIEKGWYNFVINISPAIFCGNEIDSGHMIILSHGHEYSNIIPSRWYSIEILVSQTTLDDENIYLDPHIIRHPETATIPLPVELVGIFRRLAAMTFGERQAVPLDTAWLRRALLRALDKALAVGERRGSTLSTHPQINGYDLAQRAIRYIKFRFGQRITVNDLAQNLNITPRALNYAIRSVFDMSPLDLVQAFRLNHVRNELWEKRLFEPAVTSAALMQDFGHLGRFSEQYRALFGELPSQTLQRIRLLVD